MQWQTLEKVQEEEDILTQQFNLLQQMVHEGSYGGYPSTENRLYGSSTDFTQFGRVAIPEGSWETHPDDYSAPSAEEQNDFVRRGYALDNHGRPIHPWFKYMVSNIAVGVVTGKGAYWNWGPNRTVDIIATHEESVLLVRRGDTGQWALPGGFIDHGETTEQAGKREFHEETGLVLPQSIHPRVVYDGPVVDPRMTANAWPETTALHFKLSDYAAETPIGADDATEAAWVPIAIARLMKLFGSHELLLELAVARM